MSELSLPIIANPTAAYGKAKAQLEEIVQFFRKQNREPKIAWTRHSRHAIEIAETLARSGTPCLVSAGGDGTAFEVINGIMRSGRSEEVRLGILPLGTGNSFLRDFGVQTALEAAERILNGNTCKVDIGKISYARDGAARVAYFHNIVGFGFVAEACRIRHTRFKWFRSYGYHAAFFYLLARLKTYRIRLRINGAPELTIPAPMLAICNSQYTGHNMRISPQSRVDDGQWEVLLAEEMSAIELLKIFLSLPSGMHLNHPKIRILPASRIDVDMEEMSYAMVDGELLESLPFRIELLPRALEIFM